MITPDEIKKKTFRIWETGRFLNAWCKKENIFPIDISTSITGGSFLSENYSEVNQWINNLISSSKEKKGYGYSINFTTVSNRQLGKQRIPDRIFIETEMDFLKLCGKKNEFNTFQSLFEYTAETLPALQNFITANPLIALKHALVWDKILDVCLYFINNPEPGLYIRQIVIPGINTKFIESHKKIISDIMTFLLPEKYNNSQPENQYHSFEKRFFLQHDEPLIRFRILDPDCYINNLSDITLPLSHFTSIKSPFKKIFITENKINGLSFPKYKESIIIFGLGYGINILKEIPWLKEKIIYYWGDIDTHGFSILSMVRGLLPECISFLMNKEILIKHKDYWSEEPEGKRFTGNLLWLNEKEKNLFDDLKNNNLGKNVRLEQELISYDSLLEFLEEIE